MIELIVSSLVSGLLSSLSPCALPIYPILLNSISRAGGGRRIVAVSFTAGLVSAFLLFYLLVTFLSTTAGERFEELLGPLTTVIYAAAALLCFSFALQSLGVLDVPFGARSLFRPVSRSGVAGAFMTGMVFSTVVSPCSLPFLVTGIIPILMSEATVLQGFTLMGVFALAMAAPILLLGVVSGHAIESLDYLRRRSNQIEKISAVFLLAAGAYFAQQAFI